MEPRSYLGEEQAEGTAKPKALRWEWAWNVLAIARRPGLVVVVSKEESGRL